MKLAEEKLVYKANSAKKMCLLRIFHECFLLCYASRFGQTQGKPISVDLVGSQCYTSMTNHNLCNFILSIENWFFLS